MTLSVTAVVARVGLGKGDVVEVDATVLGKKSATSLGFLNATLKQKKVVAARVGVDGSDTTVDVICENGARGRVVANTWYKEASCKSMGKRKITAASFTPTELLTHSEGTLSDGQSSVNLGVEASIISPSPSAVLVAAPPNNLLLSLRGIGGLSAAVKVQEMPHLVERILHMGWGVHGSDTARVAGVSHGVGVLVEYSLREGVVGKLSVRTEGTPFLAGCSRDAGIWCFGSEKGLVVHNTTLRSEVSTVTDHNASMTAICITSTLIVTASAEKINFYDYGLNAISVTTLTSVLPSLPVTMFFDSGISTISATHSTGKLAIIGRGGPVAICEISGATTHSAVLKNTEWTQAVRVLKMVNKSERLSLLSEVVGGEYSKGRYEVVKEVLKTFHSTYTTGVEKRVFTSFFRRLFLNSVQQEDIVTGYWVATTLDQPDWFTELYSAAVDIDPRLAETCLSHTPHRASISLEKTLLATTPNPSYTPEAMSTLASQPSLTPPSALLLSKLISLYTGFTAGVEYLQSQIDQATLEGRDQDAQYFRDSLPTADLIEACS